MDLYSDCLLNEETEMPDEIEVEEQVEELEERIDQNASTSLELLIS